MEKLKFKDHDNERPHLQISDSNEYMRFEMWWTFVLLVVGAGILTWFSDRVFMMEPAVHAVTWTKCGDNIECARFEVPLDYANSSFGNASLSLARYLATNKTARLGSLFTNPGGPGSSGVDYIYRAGRRLSDLVDGRYDIISWDPRGINGTTPRAECFSSEAKQNLFIANTQLERQLDIRNLSDSVDLAIFTSGLHLADARNEVLAQLCLEQSGEALKHVSTATVARDLESLHSTLEGSDAPVNYWGFSYGTIIGSYFVNMFPDRVGRVAIDGVGNPDIWANHLPHTWRKDFFADADKTLHNFYAACAKAGPDRCALAYENSTASSISNDIDHLLDQLYERPLPVPNSERPGALTQSVVRLYTYIFLQMPREWPGLASALSAAMNGDGTVIMNALFSQPQFNDTQPAEAIFSFQAVSCTDAPDYEGMNKEVVFQDLLSVLFSSNQRTSRIFSSLGITMCHHWTTRDPGRFTGPFNHTLNNPILIIGNTADPATALQNAEAVNKFMPHSSRLVIQDGSGHCSSAMASLCTARAIREYFLEGKLPPNRLVCSTDEEIFPAASPDEVDGLNWLAEAQENYSEEDIRLLKTARALGTVLEPFVSSLF